jgi:signal transduction histidine kinase
MHMAAFYGAGMLQQENGKDTGVDPACKGGHDTDDTKTIAGLKEKVAFLEKKLQIVGSVTRHDVLNQLTAIVGYNELLGMMVEDPKFKSFLEKEKFALDKIRRQFQFAKDYQNIAVDPPRWQNIRNLTNRVSDDFDLKEVRIRADTGAASVLADPLFDRVFHHLFDNALRHGETVTEIKISLRETGLSGLLLVENNGASIPATDKDKIFERGYGKGTGWGLYLAREILAVTGMDITETGEEGKGVRFEITLPPGSFRLNGVDAHAP